MLIESEIFTGFSLRDVPGGSRVAVLHLIAADGLAATEESVFNEAGLTARVALLTAHNDDASVSSAALRALQGQSVPAAAPAPGVAGAAAESVRRPSVGGTGLPGRAALLRALRDAMESKGRFDHGPQLAMLTVRGTPEIAASHGADAVTAALLGVADRLDDNLRRLDMLVHLGGPQFAACLPRAPRRDAEAILRRLSRAVSDSPIDTPCGPVAVRLDAALFSEQPSHAVSGGARAAALLATAEQAMRMQDASGQAVSSEDVAARAA